MKIYTKEEMQKIKRNDQGFTHYPTGIYPRGSKFPANSMIGANSTIGAYSEIEINSTIGAGSEIETDSTIQAFAMIGAYTRIGAGSIIRSYSRIGANTRVGANSMICACTTIGANSIIETGSIIGDNSVIGAYTRIAAGCTFKSWTTDILFLSLGKVSDHVCHELMMRDMESHPHPDLFQKWADGGGCPYRKDEQRLHNFIESREVFNMDFPRMTTVELIIAICKEKKWKMKGVK